MITENAMYKFAEKFALWIRTNNWLHNPTEEKWYRFTSDSSYDEADELELLEKYKKTLRPFFKQFIK